MWSNHVEILLIATMSFTYLCAIYFTVCAPSKTLNLLTFSALTNWKQAWAFRGYGVRSYCGHLQLHMHFWFFHLNENGCN
jgi:hypothetical protein